MPRRWPLVLVPAALLVPVVAQVPRNGALPEIAAPRPIPAPVNPGGVILRNGTGVSLKVEITTPQDDKCSQGRNVFSHVVPPGRSWEIRSSQLLCIRREKVEGNGRRRMQGWERKQPTAGRLEEVGL